MRCGGTRRIAGPPRSGAGCSVGRGLYGLDAVDGAEAVGDVVVQVGVVVATDAQLHEPAGMAATPDGGFLIADVLNNEVRKMSGD
jgi:hypothetical protein